MNTIYNVKAYLRLRDLEGRSIVQQLMKMLDEKHYVHYCRSDPNTNEITDIFWAHPDSILLARCFPSVVMVDCTYKTNRYQLPLLQIVGNTSTSKIFCIALALLYKERENNYEWAYTYLKNLFDPNTLPNVFVSDREQASMNAIEKVFPDAHLLLCTFHISKKVEQHCKPICNTKEEWTNFIQGWHDVMQAESEKDFFDRWEAFKQNCPLKFAKCMNYLATTWLIHKERFVLAWTNKVKHRDNRTNNRAEGAHAKLKRWIGSSQGTFTTLWEALDNLIKVEINEVKADFQQSMMKVRHFHKFSQFKELRSHVSHFALTKIIEEMEMIQYIGVDVHACGHVARTVYGIPCAHEIMQYERERRPIPISAIDNHWKKLSLIPDVEEVDYEPEMQLFKKKWAEATPDERHVMLKKLREIDCPSTTFLVESSPIVSKGRPKSKMSAKERKHATSTKRDPLGFEYAKLNTKCGTVNKTKSLPVKETKPKLQPQTGKNGSRFKYAISKKSHPSLAFSGEKETIALFPFHPVKQAKPKLQPPTGKNIAQFEYANLKSFGVNMAMNEATNNYMPLLPEFIWPFITKMEYVKDDRNCGYRCVASLMG